MLYSSVNSKFYTVTSRPLYFSDFEVELPLLLDASISRCFRDFDEHVKYVVVSSGEDCEGNSVGCGGHRR